MVGKARTSENSEMALKLLIKMSIYLFINDNCDSWQEKMIILGSNFKLTPLEPAGQTGFNASSGCDNSPCALKTD
jgi:hypothetical protein